MLYIFNTTICTTPGLTYHTRLISEATAREIFERFFPPVDRERFEAENGCSWLSAIGHDATAQVATSILGYDVPVSRITAAMKAGDEAICVKLRGRAPEGVILTREQMDAIGYDIVHMLARGTTSPAAEIAQNWMDPEGWHNGAPPPSLEFSVPLMHKRLVEEIDAKSAAQLEAGISHRGSDPAGMLRASMLTMLRRLVHEHLDSAVEARLSDGKVTDADLRSMREGLVDRLLDQLGEHGAQVDCGRGERDA